MGFGVICKRKRNKWPWAPEKKGKCISPRNRKRFALLSDQKETWKMAYAILPGEKSVKCSVALECLCSSPFWRVYAEHFCQYTNPKAALWARNGKCTAQKLSIKTVVLANTIGFWPVGNNNSTAGKEARKSPVWTGIWAGTFRDFAARCASDAMDCAMDGFFEKGNPR